MKKAQLDIVWFWRITITFMIVLFIYFISIDYLNAKINTGDLEEQILLNNMVSSEDCLAYSRERSYPGIIDIQKLNEERLRKCYDKSNFGFRLILTDLDNSQISKVNILSEEQSNLIDVCQSVKSYTCNKVKLYVLIKDSNKEYPGILILEGFKNDNRI